MTEEGKAYTPGNSFRARAEAQQRRYRAHELKLGFGEHAHWLNEEDAKRGANFFGQAYKVVSSRADQGKGIDKKRTLYNMLSSQAMCFNIFGNLQTDEGRIIAAKALGKFLPNLQTIKEIHLEFTPPKDVLCDQSALGGVDCDVLIEYDTSAGGSGLLAIETKFVEEEFSTCAFRKRAGKADTGGDSCPQGTCHRQDFGGCLYSSKKHYHYWEQSRRHGTLQPELLRDGIPCPFGGGLWQLWVNHTLVHALADKRQCQEAAFALCAPRGNDALLKGGETITSLRSLLTNPSSMLLIELEDLVNALESAVGLDRCWHEWIVYLRQRYLLVDCDR